MENFINKITPGIPDSEFLRSKIPMTKEEVREISLCKLNLKSNSVLYDIGCGTGSISIESSLLSPELKIFAIDSNPEATELCTKNQKKFNCKNIQIINESAPQAFKNLLKPSHAFIGGSGGKLNEILNSLYEKNPNMRIVMNAISLESISQIEKIIKTFPIQNDELTLVSISKAVKVSNFNIMNSLNPVFVFSFDFKKWFWNLLGEKKWKRT